MEEWLKVAKDFREGNITEVQYEEWKYNFPKYSSLNIDKRPHEKWLNNK